MIARALKLDPVAFRRKNLLRDGRQHASGTVLRDAPLEEVLDRLCERLNWSDPFDRGIGSVRRAAASPSRSRLRFRPRRRLRWSTSAPMAA